MKIANEDVLFHLKDIIAFYEKREKLNIEMALSHNFGIGRGNNPIVHDLMKDSHGERLHAADVLKKAIDEALHNGVVKKDPYQEILKYISWETPTNTLKMLPNLIKELTELDVEISNNRAKLMADVLDEASKMKGIKQQIKDASDDFIYKAQKSNQILTELSTVIEVKVEDLIKNADKIRESYKRVESQRGIGKPL